MRFEVNGHEMGIISGCLVSLLLSFSVIAIGAFILETILIILDFIF